MRIISGCRKGHRLKAPEGLHTRPTTDRVKESIFNLIQFHLPAVCVLDLFSGSGALGIEALSRGAERAVFVDNDRRATALIQENLESTGLASAAIVLKDDALRYLDTCKESFDLIFMDPPYNKGWISPVLEKLHLDHLLLPGGILVLETEAGGETVPEQYFKVLKTAKYGKTKITILQG